MDTVLVDCSDGAMGSSDEDDPLLILQHKIRSPIVYTTKLDDMRIFNEDLTGMDAETIINSIMKESKPKLKRKRTCTQAINFRCLNEEESPSHISTSNRKVPRTAEDNKIAICKPVTVTLVDIKYSLLRNQSTESSNSETVKTIRPLVSEKPKPAYRFPRKLKSRLIYDRQLKEADLYSLDKNFFVKEHIKLPIDSNNETIFEKLENDNNVSEISCCCWYNREFFLTSTMLGILPHETLRFMRKPHKCEFNCCTCCCRNKSKSVSNDTSAQRSSLLKPSEAPSIWVKSMSVTHASQPLSNESRKSLLSKALSVEPSEIKYPVKSSLKVEPQFFLHSTSIDFGAEYHEIGADGQIKLSLKNIGKDRQELANLKSKTADNIVGNICCWFKREEFAGRLLVLGALPNTVNFLRSAHPCSPLNCSCCCKPSKTEKPKLTLIHKAARHTNDLVSKKVNIIVRFAGVLEKPVKPVKPMSMRAATVPKNTNVVSFNVSLSALEKISKGKVTIDSILKDVIDLPHDRKKGSVRVLVGQDLTANNRTVVIECNTDLNGFTTSELTLLDIIFRAVNRVKQSVTVPDFPKNKYIRRPRVKNFKGVLYNSIYPLLLNTHLSVATDLRNKRFLPPLRAHLEQYRLSEMVSNISLWMAEAEAKQQQSRK